MTDERLGELGSLAKRAGAELTTVSAEWCRGQGQTLRVWRHSTIVSDPLALGLTLLHRRLQAEVSNRRV